MMSLEWGNFIGREVMTSSRCHSEWFSVFSGFFLGCLKKWSGHRKYSGSFCVMSFHQVRHNSPEHQRDSTVFCGCSRMDAPRGEFVWKVCFRCRKYKDPICFRGGEYFCSWCGCLFKGSGPRLSLHPKKCPRGPNLGQSNVYPWFEKRCQCELNEKLKDILQDWSLDPDWSSIQLSPPVPIDKYWWGKSHVYWFCF